MCEGRGGVVVRSPVRACARVRARARACQATTVGEPLIATGEATSTRIMCGDGRVGGRSGRGRQDEWAQFSPTGGLAGSGGDLT